MTELTSRQILDAIDRTLGEISLRFAKEAAQPVPWLGGNGAADYEKTKGGDEALVGGKINALSP